MKDFPFGRLVIALMALALVLATNAYFAWNIYVTVGVIAMPAMLGFALAIIDVGRVYSAYKSHFGHVVLGGFLYSVGFLVSMFVFVSAFSTSVKEYADEHREIQPMVLESRQVVDSLSRFKATSHQSIENDLADAKQALSDLLSKPAENSTGADAGFTVGESTTRGSYYSNKYSPNIGAAKKAVRDVKAELALFDKYATSVEFLDNFDDGTDALFSITPTTISVISIAIYLFVEVLLLVFMWRREPTGGSSLDSSACGNTGIAGTPSDRPSDRPANNPPQPPQTAQVRTGTPSVDWRGESEEDMRQLLASFVEEGRQISNRAIRMKHSVGKPRAARILEILMELMEQEKCARNQH